MTKSLLPDPTKEGWDQPFRSRTRVRAFVWDKTGGRCWYCGKQTNPWRDFSIDHVIDGLETLENLVPCCRTCNSRKLGRGIESLREKLAKASGITVYTFYFEKEALNEQQIAS